MGNKIILVRAYMKISMKNVSYCDETYGWSISSKYFDLV